MIQPNPQFDEASWIEAQVARYGPVVGSEALRSLLGFRSASAFQKARLQGQLEVAVFALPGRQGVFALTQEACTWVMAQRRLGRFGAAPQREAIK
ncbi:hypothetical protein [Aerolutibacter ruishenii]|uniref:hypothetical protein n=1 Tax=Aerolutibacter ruishenii TaxID=686800 RepID=UPI0011A2A004|nr:hypothetical protein [Lysobacter ruishenii]